MRRVLHLGVNSVAETIKAPSSPPRRAFLLSGASDASSAVRFPSLVQNIERMRAERDVSILWCSRQSLMLQHGNEEPSCVLEVWIYAYAVFHDRPKIQLPSRMKLTTDLIRVLPLVASGFLRDALCPFHQEAKRGSVRMSRRSVGHGRWSGAIWSGQGGG